MGFTYTFADVTPKYDLDFPADDAPLAEWLAFDLTRGWTHYTADAATAAQEALQAAALDSAVAEKLLSEGATLTPAECKIVAEALRGDTAEHLRYLGDFAAAAIERGGLLVS